MIKRINSHKYIAYYDSPVNVIKLLFPEGYKSDIVKRGYMHFLEHLIIQNNQSLLDELENKGGFYNGITEYNKTEIMIYGLDDIVFQNALFQDILKVEEIQMSDEEFENEKNVIKEEYDTLVLANPKSEVEKAIGSREEIENFTIEEVNQILSNPKIKPIIFLFSNINKLESNKKILHYEKNKYKFSLKEDEENIYIEGLDIFSKGQLEICFAILKNTLFIKEIRKKGEKYILNKYEYEYIKRNVINIEKRFKMMIDTSFSKYWQYLIHMLSYIVNKDVSEIQINFTDLRGAIIDKEKDLLEV